MQHCKYPETISWLCSEAFNSTNNPLECSESCISATCILKPCIINSFGLFPFTWVLLLSQLLYLFCTEYEARPRPTGVIVHLFRILLFCMVVYFFAAFVLAATFTWRIVAVNFAIMDICIIVISWNLVKSRLLMRTWAAFIFCIWTMILIIAIVTLQTLQIHNLDSDISFVLYMVSVSMLSLLVCYLGTIFIWNVMEYNTAASRAARQEEGHLSAHANLGYAEANIGPIGYITISWVRELLRRGWRGELNTVEDTFKLPPSVNIVTSADTFEKRLMHHKAMCDLSQVGLERSIRSEEDVELITGSSVNGSCDIHEDDEELLVEVQKPTQKTSARNIKKFSVMKVFFQTYGMETFPIFFLRISSDMCNLANPLLLNAFVSYLSSDDDTSVWHGARLGFSMIIVTGVGIFLEQLYFYQSWKITFKSRGAVMINVYRKMLQVNQCHLSRFSTGEIVNLMSRDAWNVSYIPLYIHQFVAMPLNLIAVICLLYIQVGFAFLAGVVLAVLCVPFNQWLSGKILFYEKQYLKYKDQRVKILTEILNGIRTVKLAALELFFTKKVGVTRDMEMQNIKYLKYLDALCVYLWAAMPVLLAVVIFYTYTFMGNQLTAATVFTVLCYVNLLIGPLNAFPWVMNYLIEAYVSFGRLDKFFDMKIFTNEEFYQMNSPKSSMNSSAGSEHDIIVDSDAESNVILNLKNCLFSYGKRLAPEELQVKSVLADTCFKILCMAETNKDDEPESVNKSFQKLRDINLSVNKGMFVGVFGTVGSGKTSFLSAIIGEMNRLEGEISTTEVQRGFGYVPQEPWLQTGTIRDNIVFGSPFDNARYGEVLSACALNDDLKSLPNSDLTQVGERGITLSGGQKARVTLARALYKDFNVYLLDDPISAVDAHVAAHLYQSCIRGILKNKTVILCTHHTHYLNEADVVISLEHGKIDNIGTPAEVLSKVSEIQDHSSKTVDSDTVKLGDKDVAAAEDVDEEDQRVGEVDSKLYLVYAKSGGTVLCILTMLWLVLMQVSKNGADWWLTYWTENMDSKHNHGNTSAVHSSAVQYYHINFIQMSGTASELDVHTVLPHAIISESADSVLEQCKFYLIIYGCIAVANSCFSLFRAFFFAFANIEASIVIHQRLLKNVLQFKNAVFTTTPIGRIVNRFSSDIGVIDDDLPFVFNILLAQSFTAMGLLAIICISVPYIIPMALIMLIALYRLQEYYRCSSRELRRIATVNMSPVYNHFNESLYGATVIKAMRATAMFQQENESRIDKANRARFNERAVQRWFAMRLQYFSMIILFVVICFGLIQKQWFPHLINSALMGLCISYCLTIRSTLTVLLATFAENEKNIISVERIEDYAMEEKFESLEGSVNPLEGWPSSGSIEFRDVTLRYGSSSDAAAALKNLSFAITGGHKVGICGRTGAGKSSILSVLFRLENICGGKILIDGVDAASVPVRQLRQKMSIIPQDPFLFSGSVRENLDQSEDKHTDEELWQALRRAHCDEAVTALGGLEAEVGEKGQYFSAGQKQLVCLARALLLNTRILCLDEATANVDETTDSKIQQTIREEFNNQTVITIAHRINTILHCDRVIVMDVGRVAESGTPVSLLADNDSIFAQLVNQSGSTSSVLIAEDAPAT